MSSRPVRLHHLPYAWALVLVLLLLGPALGPGYVLSYDMVWVPQLAMRPDFLGLGSALPRAVPSDAVVAVLDTVVPAMLLQKLVLAGPLLAAAAGMLRFVGSSLTARVVVVTLTVWNPFVVERLGIGHWTILVGYGVLPWLVLAGNRARETGRLPWSLLVLMPLGSLSATAGLVSLVALLVSVGGLRSRREAALLGRAAVLGVLANGPWLVAGLLHAGTAELHGATAPFALHGEGSLPAPLAALSLGGIWNALVVPASRQGVSSWIFAAVLVLLAGLGARAWWRSRSGPPPGRLLVLWGIGMGVACLTWAAPAAVSWFAAQVPGGGLLRDGTRSLALCLPAWAALPAVGAARLARLVGGADAPLRAFVAAACTLLPVALLYDAGWGLSAELRPVDYPPAWARARAVVAGRSGDVVLLPFSPYRAPAWNHARPVLDPLGRYLRPDYVMSGAVVVDGRELPDDDPEARRVQRALAAPDPSARSALLRGAGVRWVAVEHGPGARVPAIAGSTVLRSRPLEVRLLPGPVAAPLQTRAAGRAALVAAWVGYTGLLVGGVAVAVRAVVAAAGRRRDPRSRGVRGSGDRA